jgi:hypothetical protein
VRFRLGVAEAGFFPGIIFHFTYGFPSHHHARIVSGFLIGLPVAEAVGAPISTALLGPGWPVRAAPTVVQQQTGSDSAIGRGAEAARAGAAHLDPSGRCWKRNADHHSECSGEELGIAPMRWQSGYNSCAARSGCWTTSRRRTPLMCFAERLATAEAAPGPRKKCWLCFSTPGTQPDSNGMAQPHHRASSSKQVARFSPLRVQRLGRREDHLPAFAAKLPLAQDGRSKASASATSMPTDCGAGGTDEAVRFATASGRSLFRSFHRRS